MTTPITFEQASTVTDQPTIRAATLALLANPPAPLQPAPVAGWSERAPQRLLVEDFSTQMANEARIRALIAGTISPQQAALAGPSWVRACLGWFAEDYIPALPAVFDVPFLCAATSAPLTVDASTAIQIQATDGQIFLCTQATAVTFNSAGSYLGTLRFTARTAGTVSNSGPTAIANGKILTGPAGLALTGTPTRVTAGRDIETPAAAITRCLGKWARLGAGWTDQAFDYLIPFYAPTVTQWIVRSDNPFGPGTTGVVLADAAGPATDDEVAAVSAGLGSSSVRPLGSGGVTVTKAGLYTLTVTAVLGNDGSNATLHADALAALALLQGVFPIGGALDPSLTTSLLRGDAVGTVSVYLYDNSVKKVTINAPGFASVISVTLSGAAAIPQVLGWNQYLSVTPSISP